jgi:hypothetical protein
MMGREVRMVKPGWEHPKDHKGSNKPLFPHKFYAGSLKDFLEVQKEKGLQAAIEKFGEAPDLNDYMPDWKEGEATLFCMYETCTEGTPISPAFENVEDLAYWLADNGASSFGSMTATYEQWLATCKSGFAFSAAIVGGNLISGVEAVAALKKEA